MSIPLMLTFFSESYLMDIIEAMPSENIPGMESCSGEVSRALLADGNCVHHESDWRGKIAFVEHILPVALDGVDAGVERCVDARACENTW